LQSRVLFPLTAPSRIPEAEQEEAGVSAGLSFMLWNREDYWRFLAALRPAFFRPFFAAFFPPLRPFFAAMMTSPFMEVLALSRSPGGSARRRPSRPWRS